MEMGRLFECTRMPFYIKNAFLGTARCNMICVLPCLETHFLVQANEPSDGVGLPFLHLNNLCGSLLLVSSVGYGNHSLRQVYKGLTRYCVGIQRRRRTLVAVFADTLHQWNLRQ